MVGIDDSKYFKMQPNIEFFGADKGEWLAKVMNYYNGDPLFVSEFSTLTLPRGYLVNFEGGVVVSDREINVYGVKWVLDESEGN